jgi:uncharacterized membrane protein YhaH (DUF805 family)
MKWTWYLFSFEGRINRELFWAFFGPLVVLLVCAELSTNTGNPGQMNDVSLVITLVTLWPSLAIQAKGWHDTDRSAWWILINFVPVIGGIWALVVTGFFSGTSGQNRFGNRRGNATPE